MSNTTWHADHLPPMIGKVAVVTGANSGLGWEITLALARHGARVIMACRDEAKTQQAMQALRRQVPDARLGFQQINLANLHSVRAAGAAIAAGHERLDLLVNNAGVMFLPYSQTADGVEIHMASNHLGHFLLTGLLLPLLQRAGQARVVTMSSGFAESGHLPQDSLQGDPHLSRFRAYSDSKLGNLVFARSLAERLAGNQSGVASLAAHPGYAATNLQFGMANEMKSPMMASLNRLFAHACNALLAQSAAQGALPALYAATSPQAANGDYIGPGGWGGTRGMPAQARVPRQALDKARAARFWALSEQYAGFKY